MNRALGVTMEIGIVRSLEEVRRVEWLVGTIVKRTQILEQEPILPEATRIDSVQTGTINSKYSTQHVPVRVVQAVLVSGNVI